MKKNIQKLLVVSLSVMFGFVMAACDGNNSSNSNSSDPVTDSSTPVHTHEFTSSVTKEATCTEKGEMTFTCKCGEGTYTEEISMKPHTLSHHAAVEKACDAAGSVEHWTCEDCQAYFLDEAGTQPTTAEQVVVAASHGTLVHHAAVAATCDTDGNVEHWTCEDCQAYFLDEAGTQPTTAEQVVVAASHGTLVHHAAVSKTCDTAGSVEHWTCEDCHDYFLDEAGTQETTAEQVVVAASHGTLVHHEAQAPTCIATGKEEHWTCEDCQAYFLDEAGTQETTVEQVTIATIPHSMGEYYVAFVEDGFATLKKDCANCNHFEAIDVAAPTVYRDQIADEAALATYFTVNRENGYGYTFEWVDGALRNTNSEVKSSNAEISLTALVDGVFTFDVAVWSESNYDFLVINQVSAATSFSSQVYTSKVSGMNNQEITKTITIEVKAGDVITFNKKSDSSGFYGPDGDKDYAKIKNISFTSPTVPANAEYSVITFDSNGGNEVSPVAWYKNQMVEQLPIPTKEGHIFKGWVVGEENVGTSYAPAANTHMVASWATAYQVTFVLNNGQENVVITVEENTVASIQYPEKDGFIFAGWFIDEACTVEYSDANIIENTTIYAKWEDIPDYVGTYAGVEVWGSTSGDDGNLSGNKKLTISEEFAMSGAISGTIDTLSYDETTGHLTYNYSGSNYVMMYVEQGQYKFVVANYSKSTTDPINGTDFYVFVRGASTTTGSAANQYVWDEGKQRVFSVLVDETTIVFYINSTTNEFYGNVTVTALDGTVIEPKFDAINAATSLKITDASGVVVKEFAKDGKEFVALDGKQGTYTGSLGSVTLDGAGNATVDGATTTYVVAGEKVEIVVGGKTTTITITGETYAVTTDGTEGTYTGEYGTFVSNGDGTATIGGTTVTYIKSGNRVTYVVEEASTTITLNEDGTYSGKAPFAGLTFTGTFYNEWDEYNSSMRIVFEDGADIAGTLYSGSGTTYYFNFTGEYEGNTLVLTITKAIDSGAKGKTITLTLEGNTLTVVNSTITNSAYSFDNNGSVSCPEM